MSGQKMVDGEGDDVLRVYEESVHIENACANRGKATAFNQYLVMHVHVSLESSRPSRLHANIHLCKC